MPRNSSDVESIFQFFFLCFTLPSTNYHIIAFALVNVPFVLPLFLYVLFLGIRQWRSGAKISNTDVFTYNLVSIQVFASLESAVVAINMFLKTELIVQMGIYMFLINNSAIIAFQIFTCFERYLAVLHPVVYLSLKSQTWTLFRNLSCAVVWLLSVIQAVCIHRIDSVAGFFSYTLLGLFFSLVAVLFCNVCVLRALLRPAPGDGAKGNASKQKALYTITAITGALLFKFGGDVFCLIGYLISDILHDNDTDKSCALYFSVLWFTLPNTLV
ncbi:hypothetical protein NQD34_013382, partial [Periophthalmus magnuspinnatus]